MDFISGFSKVEGFRSILVVVDRFSIIEEVVRIFFNNVVKHFGMPKDIVSDQDMRFTGRFWVEVFKMWGTECMFSSANHPQTNG